MLAASVSCAWVACSEGERAPLPIALRWVPSPRALASLVGGTDRVGRAISFRWGDRPVDRFTSLRSLGGPTVRSGLVVGSPRAGGPSGGKVPAAGAKRRPEVRGLVKRHRWHLVGRFGVCAWVACSEGGASPPTHRFAMGPFPPGTRFARWGDRPRVACLEVAASEGYARGHDKSSGSFSGRDRHHQFGLREVSARSRPRRDRAQSRHYRNAAGT